MTRVNSSKKLTPYKAKFSFKSSVLAPVAGLTVMMLVLGLLNTQWISAQAQYRFFNPSDSASAPVNGSAIDPSIAPQVVIPTINLKAPIVFDEPSYEEARIQLALRRGTLHYANTAEPGQKGNIVVFGHSSGQLWAPGDYKFVFTLLNKLQNDDKIMIDYKGTRYIYQVKNIKVVDPEDLSILSPTQDPTLTLVTCTPVGTSKYRLVIQANQISPRPETARQPTESTQSSDIKRLPSSDTRPIWQSLRSN